jgi:Spx/MgsR family transcriptional regulator
MIKIYGIKNCDSVKKAIKFLKEKNLDYELNDFKINSVDESKIKEWLKSVELSKLFNSKSTTYRNHKLKDLNLDEDGKIEWMAKENLLIKRPVIEYKDRVIVGFDEKLYEEIFII